MPKALSPPPSTLATDHTLPISPVLPARLIRVSPFPTGEPHFGCTGGNRFDAPGWRAGVSEFRTCYFGLSLAVAVAESLLHDEIPIGGEFHISPGLLAAHFIHRFQGHTLRLLDLCGATLKRQAGHADLAGSLDFAVTQLWSLAVFNNPLKFDGFSYMSRQMNTQRAVVLFDRAIPRLKPSAPATPLYAAAEFAAIMKRFAIIPI